MPAGALHVSHDVREMLAQWAGLHLSSCQCPHALVPAASPPSTQPIKTWRSCKMRPLSDSCRRAVSQMCTDTTQQLRRAPAPQRQAQHAAAAGRQPQAARVSNTTGGSGSSQHPHPAPRRRQGVWRGNQLHSPALYLKSTVALERGHLPWLHLAPE